MNKLTDSEKKKVIRSEATRAYMFGNNSVYAKDRLQIPMIIAKKEVLITTDVVEVDIPLLLSKSTLKKGNAVINFEKDTITLFGSEENLLESASGHYMILVHNH